MMNISTERGFIYLIYLYRGIYIYIYIYISLIINYQITKLGQLISIIDSNAFWNYFKSFGGLVPNPDTFQFNN